MTKCFKNTHTDFNTSWRESPSSNSWESTLPVPQGLVILVCARVCGICNVQLLPLEVASIQLIKKMCCLLGFVTFTKKFVND